MTIKPLTLVTDPQQVLILSLSWSKPADKIKIPGMLDTVGSFVNINRGCLAMNIDKHLVIDTFKRHGYEVINHD